MTENDTDNETCTISCSTCGFEVSSESVEYAMEQFNKHINSMSRCPGSIEEGDIDVEGTERIDEIGVFQAFEATEAEWSEIKCPNGCYEPYEATPKDMRAAANLPHCENCDSVHLVRWGELQI